MQSQNKDKPVAPGGRGASGGVNRGAIERSGTFGRFSVDRTRYDMFVRLIFFFIS